jgi:hypothetical protein
VCRVEPLWESIDWYMRRYLDERDVGALTLSHLYLLIGCSLPLWWLLASLTPVLTSRTIGSTPVVDSTSTSSSNSIAAPDDRVVVLRCTSSGDDAQAVLVAESLGFLQASVALCGFMSVGVADAVAAVVGVALGRRRCARVRSVVLQR